MNRYLLTFKSWFGHAAVITLMCCLIYIVAQQNFRQMTNSPQLETARDAATAINGGANPRSLAGTGSPIEISQSLSPFLVIYDAKGNLVAGNAVLNGQPLKIPQGVLNYIVKNHKDAASWQPQVGVRQAMVGFSTANNAYIVVAGRSLQITEERIATLGSQLLFGWGMSLLAMLFVVFLQMLMIKKPDD